jgi:hypothetical protein
MTGTSAGGSIAATGTVALGEFARTVKSANAGASWLTFDLFFHTTADLEIAAPQLNPARVAAVYGLAADDVQVFIVSALSVIKVTIPRGPALGSVGERDFDGVQQHALLIDLPISTPGGWEPHR